MTGRDRLLQSLAPELVEAIEQLVGERVQAELDAQPIAISGSPWLSLEDAASYLNVSTRTVERAVKLKRLGVSHIGRRPIFKRKELDRYVQAAGEEKRQPLHPAARKGA